MQGSGEAEDSTLAKTETLKGRGRREARGDATQGRTFAPGRGAGDGLQRVPLPASVASCTLPQGSMDPHPLEGSRLSCLRRSCHSRPPWPKGPGQR